MSKAEKKIIPKISEKEWATYRRLIQYAMPYKGRLFIGVIFGILFGGSTAGIIPALKKTLDSIFLTDQIEWSTIIAVAIALPVLALLRGVGHYVSVYYIEWVGQRVVMDLRNAIFGRLQDLSVLFYSKTKAGELISRSANDTMLIERAVSTVLGDLVRQPFALIFLVGVVIWLDVKLAFISLVLFPICIIPVALFGRRVRRFARQSQQKLADIVSILQETIVGVRIVKAFGMEDYERGRFAKHCKSVFSWAMGVVKAKAAVEPVIVFISVIGFSLMLLYAHWAGMSMSTFLTFGIAMVALYEPVKKLSRIHLAIQQSSAAADRVFEILDEAITVQEKPDAVELKAGLESVVFKDVSFTYGDEPILQGIDLHVQAGQCLAIVGSSGSGKTTLVSLLPRFFDVTGGLIQINGRDIRDYTLDSLRRQMGLVSQDTFLFNDTVANNIAYGQTEADRSSIEAAARRANAHDFIAALPQGYDTVIGDRGVRLSGGQCQRLAIARAMLRNPPIMILDEATSALDTESERLVQAALDELMENRTVFAIAHRLSTIKHADRIIVLDKGRIAEEGTHEELLAKSGLYRYLHDLQFQV